MVTLLSLDTLALARGQKPVDKLRICFASSDYSEFAFFRDSFLKSILVLKILHMSCFLQLWLALFQSLIRLEKPAPLFG